MILLKLSFGKDQDEKKFEIIKDELLSSAVKRSLEGIHLGDSFAADTFNVVVNGHLIESDIWDKISTKEKDNIVIAPKIQGGSSGQLFKQFLIIAVTVAATYFLGPAGAQLTGLAFGAAVAGVTIGASLLFNALIPPPVPELGGLGGLGDISSSQMYAITGQSNQSKRLGIVPKVYGSHRMFPTLAATPYTELAVSPGVVAHRVIQDLEYSAKVVGTVGNDITIKYQDGGVAGDEVATASGRTVTITFENGVSTASQIRTAVLASPAATALVRVSLRELGSETQEVEGDNTLGGGEDAGDTIQYLYSIYDFGLGTPQISQLQIGDTPLSTDSFEDFNYRFVDPLRPLVSEDSFDDFLESDFKFYTSKRNTTNLAINLFDGDENIQFTDVNPDDVQQEIILDFVCPRGLFGYSSSGITGDRSIQLDIQFALVGTSNWKPYNDISAVDSHQSVGGNDVTDFDQYIYPDFSGDYYITNGYTSGSYNSSSNSVATFGFKSGQNKLLVVDDSRWEVGAKCFNGKTLLGVIQSISILGDGKTELTLDRVLVPNSQASQVFYRGGYGAYGGTASFGGAKGIIKIRSSRHESGAAVITGSKQSSVYGQVRFTPKDIGQFQVRIRRIRTFGTYLAQVGDELTWGALTTSFHSLPINSDKRHVFLELKIKATNQLNGYVQNVSGIATQVVRKYDPITQTWPRSTTNNPAWVFCDLLTGEVNKKAISNTRLDLDSIVEWADYCDEVPTPPDGHTYLEPRFQCNFILDFDSTLQSALQQVGGAAQASLNIIDGKYGVLIDRFKDIPVQIFTPRNSRDFSSTRNYGPRPHGVKVKYIDPQLAWDVQETIAYDNGYDVSNATELEELTSFACTNYEQAWRFGRYMIAQNKLRQETISILVDFENLICTRGDYVQITQDVMRVGGTPARVNYLSGTTIRTDDSLDINPAINYGYIFRSSTTGEISETATLTPITANEFIVDGDIPAIGDLIVIGEVGSIVFDCIVKAISPNDDMSASLTLIEKADAIFDYESESDLPEYDPQISQTSRPDWYPPKAVTDLTLGDNFWECSQTQSGYNYYAEIVWNMPAGSVFEFFEIWVNDGRGYLLHTTTTAKYFRYNVEDHSRLGNEFGIKVVAVSTTGKKLHLIEMPGVTFTPVEKSTPPSDVDSLNMSITNQVLQLSWPSIADCDVAQYEIRFSPDGNDIWEASVPLTTVSKNVNSTSVQARTGVYHLKAIDYNGNQSVVSAKAITTIPNLFDLNVVETLNDAPIFGGELEQTELLGEAVILKAEVIGDVDTIEYFDSGYYVSESVLDIDDVYTVRLQSQIRADGYKFGELMSDWLHISDVDHLNSAKSSDWAVGVEYRATDVFAAMSDWAHLSEIDHINYGAGIGFTDWRPVPTIGDATGRIFQFRIRLESLTPNVTPRLFDASIKADMPDRIDSFENLLSTASDDYIVTYDQVFKGPGTSPNVQISIDDAETGDYWTFGYKTLAGFSIRFFDNTDTQVIRQFDVVAKGYGRRHTATI